MTNQKLRLLEHPYGIARLSPADPLPAWADGDGFVSISRSDEELSIACRQDRDWACLKLTGPFAFDVTGVVLSVIRPLSEGGIGIFVVSTFDGDHLLVKQANLERAVALLAEAGHSVS